ncbi:hypothetical protein [Bryobacter aggregatus]|uniref:hypothetical protein n=1 Tax=Bryobacter aggregatus TaxID=360054 RepID=UPI00068AFD60|nr:hypothetical protein [Bryobacter aggregatus]
MADPQTWNGYAYVNNSPLNYTDPTGEGIFGTIFGVLAGVFSVNPWIGLAASAAGNGIDAAIWGPGAVGIAGTPFNIGSLTSCGGPLGNCGSIGGLWTEQSPIGPSVKDTSAIIYNAQKPTATNSTGQWHHAIGRVIYRALESDENLKGIYRARDSRFITQAKDLASHRGYQGWHREYDLLVARYIAEARNLTPVKFEAYLKDLYRTLPSLTSRFPKGLGGGMFPVLPVHKWQELVKCGGQICESGSNVY